MGLQQRTERVKRALDRFRPHLRPSFLIIGAQKAGTSALFRMLALHPSILAPVEKEHHFFDVDEAYARGFARYLKGFPLVPLRGPARVTFEATPSYLFAEQAAERIHAHLPDIPLVVVLRDPVSRAYSAWNMYRSFKPGHLFAAYHDPRSFEQAVSDELSGLPVPFAHRYLARGEYAGQLQRFFRIHGRERLTVIDYRDLLRTPDQVLERLCHVLGLPPFTGDPVVFSLRDNVRPYPAPLDPAMAERLRAHFKPHMEALQALLGPQWDLLEQRPRP